MQLITHTKAGREFFASGCAPKRAQWCEWIANEVILGKIIGGRPYVDANWFAASGPVLTPLNKTIGSEVTALDLLRS